MRIPQGRRETEFQWIRENFLERTEKWYDATLLFLNWTAFDTKQVNLMGYLMNQANEGLIVISTTRPIPNPNLEILLQDRCKTSFGEVDFFVQEKVTVAKDRPKVDLLADF